MQVKIYDPTMGVAYVIYNINKKRKKSLYSSAGRISAIKEYCDKNKIDYSKCKENTVDGCKYFET